MGSHTIQIEGFVSFRGGLAKKGIEFWPRCGFVPALVLLASEQETRKIRLLLPLLRQQGFAEFGDFRVTHDLIRNDGGFRLK
jgi:hypothetical protein